MNGWGWGLIGLGALMVGVPAAWALLVRHLRHEQKPGKHRRQRDGHA